VRFAYFLLADAGSAHEGKLNLLGIGVRKIQADELPANVSLTIAAEIEGSHEEAGSYPWKLTITEPDGSEATMTAKEAELPAATVSADLPVSTVMVIAFLRSYTIAGLYVLRAHFGDIEAEYRFIVERNKAKRVRGSRAKKR
jgi:hypothetical protein